MTHHTHTLLPILLRISEQAQDAGDVETLNRCLDAWDLLFENKIGMTRDLTRSMAQ